MIKAAGMKQLDTLQILDMAKNRSHHNQSLRKEIEDLNIKQIYGPEF